MMTASFRNAAARLILNYIKTGEDIRRELGESAAEFLPELDDTDRVKLTQSVGAVRYAPEEERLDLLSDMWNIAANDDEIVEDADLFILSAAEALDLPISTVEIVRPARFGKGSDAIEQIAVNG